MLAKQHLCQPSEKRVIGTQSGSPGCMQKCRQSPSGILSRKKRWKQSADWNARVASWPAPAMTRPPVCDCPMPAQPTGPALAGAASWALGERSVSGTTASCGAVEGSKGQQGCCGRCALNPSACGPGANKRVAALLERSRG